MADDDGLRLVGLTGGIASGKSTVSGMFRSLGAPIIDADQVAREVVAPGEPALAEIAARFPGVVDGSGNLDRAALGARVFADAGERQALNAILHPRIQQRVLEKTWALADAGVRLAIYDVPLLVENRLQDSLSGVILVSVPPEVQRARLMARNGYSPEEAQARIDAQLPLEEKKKVATWIIDNAGTVEETRRQVEQVWKALQAPQ